jgi:hypothetical protein
MRIDIQVEGITPLLCNRFTDEAAEAATSGTRGSSAGQDRGTPQEIAASKIYWAADGNPMIPQTNLMRSIVEGGQFEKIGKKQVTTTKSSIMYACVAISGVIVPLQHQQPWKVFTCPVRIPSTGGRILSHRPMFDDWKLDFEAELDTSIMGVKMFRQIVDHAGKRIGLGDYRPATKGPFGRYVVTRWQQVNEAA